MQITVFAARPRRAYLLGCAGWWIWWLLVPAVVAQPRRADFRQYATVSPTGYVNPVTDTLTVLSWNVEHFVDQHDNPYIRNRREDRSDSLVGTKARLLAEALRRADADVVVLQEFESGAYLQHLADSLWPELGYRFFAAAESFDWYMNVVVMSRVPLGTVYSYQTVTTPVLHTPDSTGRLETQSQLNTRLLAVDVLVSDQFVFTLAGAHLKAGRGERDVGMRLGQINFLRSQFARFQRENRKANLLLVGDLNAVPGSTEIETLLGRGTRVRLVDPLPDSVHTHPSDGPTRRLDHILPNTAMHQRLVPGSVQVPYLLDRQDMRTLSDHLPVRAQFRVR